MSRLEAMRCEWCERGWMRLAHVGSNVWTCHECAWTIITYSGICRDIKALKPEIQQAIMTLLERQFTMSNSSQM